MSSKGKQKNIITKKMDSLYNLLDVGGRKRVW